MENEILDKGGLLLFKKYIPQQMIRELKWYTRKYLLYTKEGGIGRMKEQKGHETENKEQNGRSPSLSVYVQCEWI